MKITISNQDTHVQRTTYKTWQQLIHHCSDGLIERVSLLNRSFKNPICVHPDFLPTPDGLSKDCPLHYISSLETLDIPTNTYDLVLFSPFLQWTHDVPGMLVQAYESLMDGGFFVACFFGQDTLIELKAVCAEIDLDYTGGLQQRFLPTIHTKDAGMLMQRAGFASPTADIEHLTFSVPSVESLIHCLRDSGLTNTKGKAHMSHITTEMLPRKFIEEANRRYQANYLHASGGLNVTVDLIFMCGWKQPVLKSITR